MYKYNNINVQIPAQMFKDEEQKCIVHSLKAHWTNINAQLKIHNNTNTEVVAKSAFSLKDYWTNTRPTVQTDHYPVCIGEKSEAWKSVQVFIWLDVNEWWGLIVGIVLVQSLDFDQITGNNIRYRHSIAMTLSFIKKSINSMCTVAPVYKQYACPLWLGWVWQRRPVSLDVKWLVKLG